MESDINTEVRACLALAEAFDQKDISCPKHSHELQDELESKYGKNKKKEHRDLKAEMEGRLNVMYDLINNRPLSHHDIRNGYAREHLIYLLGCQIYSLAKQIHKESFFTAIQQGKAEPTEGSLAK
jgi:hypothetical protein